MESQTYIDSDSALNWLEFETRMRRVIKELMTNSVDQIKLQEDQIRQIHIVNEELQDRLKEVEYLLYQSEDKHDRFEEIKKRISEVELARKNDIIVIREGQVQSQRNVENKIFQFESQLHKLDKFVSITLMQPQLQEKMVHSTVSDFEGIENKLISHKQQLKDEIEKHIHQINEDMKKKADHIRGMSLILYKQQPQIETMQSQVLQLQDIDEQHNAMLNDLQMHIEDLKAKKTDLTDHIELKDNLEERLKSLADNFEVQVDRMLNNENYVQKYIPMYVQRQINDNFEQVLKKSQLKKLGKYMEIKMPILMASMFEDDGIPNLQEFQREFHRSIMEGVQSSQEKFIQNAMSNEKERSKAKWQIQGGSGSKLSKMANHSSPSETPKNINAVQSKCQTQISFQMAPSQFKLLKKDQKLNKSEKFDNNDEKSYPNVTPIIKNLKVSDSDSDGEPEDKLNKIYQDENETESEIAKESKDFDDSVDFEEQLKKEVTEMLKLKIDTFENRLQYMMKDHEKGCKLEFKMYESHIKDQVHSMNQYVSEVHANHISDLNNMRKDKGEQVIINQMLVKKVQFLDSFKKEQKQLLEQVLSFGSLFQTFMKIFNACTEAEEQTRINLDEQVDDIVGRGNSKEQLNQTKTIDRSLSPLLGHNLSTLQSMEYQTNASGLGNSKGSLNVRKYLLDKNGKQISDKLVAALQVAIGKQKVDSISIREWGDQQYSKSDIIYQYKCIEHLLTETLGNVQKILSGDEIKPIKKVGIQQSRTRQSSPTTTKQDLLVVDQSLNMSKLVTGIEPSIISNSQNHTRHMGSQLGSSGVLNRKKGSVQLDSKTSGHMKTIFSKKAPFGALTIEDQQLLHQTVILNHPRGGTLRNTELLESIHAPSKQGLPVINTTKRNYINQSTEE